MRVYSILFFLAMIVFTWLYNSWDESSGAVSQVIQKDLREANGSPLLFQKFASLINGDRVRARSSWLSFKQVQYWIKDKSVFGGREQDADPALDDDRRISAIASNDFYYFRINRKLLKVSVKETMGVETIVIPSRISHFNNVIDFERNFSLGADRFNTITLSIAGNRTDTLLTAYYDPAFSAYKYRLDRTLRDFLQGDKTFDACVSRNAMIVMPTRGSSKVCYVPIFPENGIDTDASKIVDLHMDNILEIFQVEGGVYLETLKDGKPEFGLITTAGIYKHLAFKVIPVFNSSFVAVIDSGKYLRFAPGPLAYRRNGNTATGSQMPVSISGGYGIYDVGESETGRARYFIKLRDEGERSRLKYMLYLASEYRVDSLHVRSLFSDPLYGDTYIFKDLFLLDSLGTNNYVPYDFSGRKIPSGRNDSLLFDLIGRRTVVSPTVNLSGIFLLPLGQDLIVLRRSSPNIVTASFGSGSSWKFREDMFNYEVSSDPYYIVIFACGVLMVYFLGRSLLEVFQLKKTLWPLTLPSTRLRSEAYKMRMTYVNLESLSKKREMMQQLGISFGIFGVLVSAVVFKASSLDIGNDWKDPHTVINVLKPIVILLFIESFSFYFLRQYRIIFNEYKLFYALFLYMLDTNGIEELDEINDLSPETKTLLQQRLQGTRYDIYEKDTKEKIDEFERKSLVDVVDKLKNGSHGDKG